MQTSTGYFISVSWILPSIPSKRRIKTISLISLNTLLSTPDTLVISLTFSNTLFSTLDTLDYFLDISEYSILKSEYLRIVVISLTFSNSLSVTSSMLLAIIWYFISVSWIPRIYSQRQILWSTISQIFPNILFSTQANSWYFKIISRIALNILFSTPDSYFLDIIKFSRSLLVTSGY